MNTLQRIRNSPVEPYARRATLLLQLAVVLVCAFGMTWLARPRRSPTGHRQQSMVVRRRRARCRAVVAHAAVAWPAGLRGELMKPARNPAKPSCAAPTARQPRGRVIQTVGVTLAPPSGEFPAAEMALREPKSPHARQAASRGPPTVWITLFACEGKC
jgi:hypothetical protein